jgi:hypothetical protein
MGKLLDLVLRDTQMRRTSAKHGGEYSGRCPFCNLGRDRYKVWDALDRFACLGPEHGRAGCGLAGDRIQYVRLRDGVGFREACARLGLDPDALPRAHAGSEALMLAYPAHAPTMLSETYPTPTLPPTPLWQARGADWANECAARLWQPEGARRRPGS